MPELRRNFTSGKMNKDDDERLVPNGEYRDAMNVQVLTSEGSEVGSIQNILGNTEGCIWNNVGNVNPIQPGSVTVGSVSDEKNDTLYWLLAGTPAEDVNNWISNIANLTLPIFAQDMIARKTPTGCEPVLVDKWATILDNQNQATFFNNLNESQLTVPNPSLLDHVLPGMTVTGYTCAGVATPTTSTVTSIGSDFNISTSFTLGSILGPASTPTYDVDALIELERCRAGSGCQSITTALPPMGTPPFPRCCNQGNPANNLLLTGNIYLIGANAPINVGDSFQLSAPHFSAPSATVLQGATPLTNPPNTCVATITNNVQGCRLDHGAGVSGADYTSFHGDNNYPSNADCHLFTKITLDDCAGNAVTWANNFNTGTPDVLGVQFNPTMAGWVNNPVLRVGASVHSSNNPQGMLQYSQVLHSPRGTYTTTLPSQPVPTNQLILPTNSPWLNEIYDTVYPNGVFDASAFIQVQPQTGSNALWTHSNACIDPTSVSAPVTPAPPAPQIPVYDNDFNVIDCSSIGQTPPTIVNPSVIINNYGIYNPMQLNSPSSSPVNLTGQFNASMIHLSDPIDLTAGYCYLHFEADRVLNFQPGQLITGLNIVDDMLYWVDGIEATSTEPKKINISRSIQGTHPSGGRHTRLINTARSMTQVGPLQVPLKEEHITVIRKSPTTPLDFILNSGREEGKSYSGVFEVTTDPTTNPNLSSIIGSSKGSNTFDLSGLQVGDKFKILIPEDTLGNNSFILGWKIGDSVLIKEYDQSSPTSVGIQPPVPLATYSIRGIIKQWSDTSFVADSTATGYPGVANINRSQWTSPNYPAAQGTAKVMIEITAIDGVPATAGAPNADPLKFVIDREDVEEKVFEFKFPRFSYRYKYEDGEYSTFAPWTQVAFLPGSFRYHPKEGYNLGMTNRTTSVTLKNFVPNDIPDDVVSVDILYKEDVSPNVYLIETIKPDASSQGTLQFSLNAPAQYWQNNQYEITSDTIHAILPSNQLLRPWDNVPLKAAAQEVTKNRVVYGNYIQNFDLYTPQSFVGGTTRYSPSFEISVSSFENNSGSVKSIKSLREYQLGVVFIDDYGRETPVISEVGSTFKVLKGDANRPNRIQVGFSDGSNAPLNMKYFKFFIKETAGEYYNLAMDRFYDAEDDNIWLAFPSTDRNKLEVDDYIILKKGVESDELVEEAARYKILAIENEAPDFIKTQQYEVDNKANDQSTSLFGTTSTTWPLEGKDKFEMDYSLWASSTGKDLWDINQHVDGKLYVDFTRKNSPGNTARYRITEITWSNSHLLSDPTNSAVNGQYSVHLDRPLEDDVNFLVDDPDNPNTIHADTVVHIYKYVVENKAQFDGRFFVKIHQDSILKSYIKPIYNSETTDLRTTNEVKIYFADEVGDTGTASKHWPPGDFGGVDPNAAMTIVSPTQQYDHGCANGANYSYCDSLSWGYFFLPHPYWGGNLGTIFTPPWDNTIQKNVWSRPNPQVPNYTAREIDKRIRKQADTGIWFIDNAPCAGSTPERVGGSANTLWYPPSSGGGCGGGIQNYFTSTSDTSMVDLSFGPINASIEGPGEGDHIMTSTGANWNQEHNVIGYNNVEDFFLIGEEASNPNLKNDGGMTKSLDTPSNKFRFKEDPAGTIYTIQPGLSKRNIFSYSDGSDIGSMSVGYPFSQNFRKTHSFWTKPSFQSGFDPVISQAGNGLIDNGAIIQVPMCNSVGGTTGGTTINNNATSLLTTLKDCVIYVTTLTGTNTGTGNATMPITRGMVLVEYNLALAGAPGAGTIVPTASDAPGGIPNWPMIRDIVDKTNYFEIYLQGTTRPLTTADINITPTNNREYVFRQPIMNGFSPGSAYLKGVNSPLTGLLGEVGYTIEFVDEIAPVEILPENPAVWETEPKETTDLDIYYEASGYIPAKLDDTTIQTLLPISTIVKSPDNSLSTAGITLIANNTLGLNGDQIKISPLPCADDGTITSPLCQPGQTPITGASQIASTSGSTLVFKRLDGFEVDIQVDQVIFDTASTIPGDVSFVLKNNIYNRSNFLLNWFNCYSFGNGVESNRIRDNFNQPFISNGVTASTTLSDKYEREHRKYGLIYSGIYNSTSGINNLNQFIMAEKITKDINPIYGSIQKLHTRDSDLVTLCEDKVLKILANKDALFNADGNTQLTASENVLGQTIPFVGEYGISKNPESFASEAYRAYFTDKVRGSVMRLSRDGLTPISEHGMNDWFKDNLALSSHLLGSYDDRKDEYNLTLIQQDNPPTSYSKTISFQEKSKGWVSFKSFIYENAISCANNYYSFKDGNLWKHHVTHDLNNNPIDRNTFYGPGNYVNSRVDVILNSSAESIKSFNTLGYEGSQSRVIQLLQYNIFDAVGNVTNTLNDNEYYNLGTKDGWYVSMLNTDQQNGGVPEFIEKEGKWFNYLRGQGITINPLTGVVTRGTFDTASLNAIGLGMFESSSATIAAGCAVDGVTYDFTDSAYSTIGYCSLFAGDPTTIITQTAPGNFITQTYYDQISCESSGICSDQAFDNDEAGCLAVVGNTWTPDYVWNLIDLSSYAGTVAFNINPSSISDNGSCIPIIEGCMDPLADNYNDWDTDGQSNPITHSPYIDINTQPTPTPCIRTGCTDSTAFNECTACNNPCVDDLGVSNGRGPVNGVPDACCQDVISGCIDGSTFVATADGLTYSTQSNYNPLANTDDGSCIPTVLGCTIAGDPCENTNANTEYAVSTCCPAVPGCTDSLARNYDPNAGVDDGSCKNCSYTTSTLTNLIPGHNPNDHLTNIDGAGTCSDPAFNDDKTNCVAVATNTWTDYTGGCKWCWIAKELDTSNVKTTLSACGSNLPCPDYYGSSNQLHGHMTPANDPVLSTPTNPVLLPSNSNNRSASLSWVATNDPSSSNNITATTGFGPGIQTIGNIGTVLPIEYFVISIYDGGVRGSGTCPFGGGGSINGTHKCRTVLLSQHALYPSGTTTLFGGTTTPTTHDDSWKTYGGKNTTFTLDWSGFDPNATNQAPSIIITRHGHVSGTGGLDWGYTYFVEIGVKCVGDPVVYMPSTSPNQSGGAGGFNGFGIPQSAAGLGANADLGWKGGLLAGAVYCV